MSDDYATPPAPSLADEFEHDVLFRYYPDAYCRIRKNIAVSTLAALRAAESDEAKRNAAIAAVVDKIRISEDITQYSGWARAVCRDVVREAEARLKNGK